MLPGKIGVGAASAVDPKGGTTRNKFCREKISFSPEKLADLCSSFYRKRYEEEKKTFYGLPHFSKTAKALESVEKALLDTPPGTFLLRIGHYSHVECMTITDNMPETRMVKGRLMPFGTTRTLADGVYPFGWIRLVPCNSEEYNVLLAQRGKPAETRQYTSFLPSGGPKVGKAHGHY